MKFLKYTITILVFISIALFIFSCGTNTPSSSQLNQQANTNAINNIPITAYQANTHKNLVTVQAIDLLLSPNNPGNLTSKQKNFLIKYRDSIEAGAAEEDSPLTRTFNHFFDPVNNMPLTDLGIMTVVNPTLGVTALQWMLNGDSYMSEMTSQNFKKEIIYFDPNNPGKSTSMITITRGFGHVVHLFQDMTSVPHTRNDAHPPFA